MKQFSIHKVNKPMMRHKSGAADQEDLSDSNKYPGSGSGDVDAGQITGAAISGTGRHEVRPGQEQSSLLSAEEQEALQPKEIKVVNPWIHEATHKEYLESVKVSALVVLRSYLNIIF